MVVELIAHKTNFLCKFFHLYTCIVTSGLSVGRAPKINFYIRSSNVFQRTSFSGRTFREIAKSECTVVFPLCRSSRSGARENCSYRGYLSNFLFAFSKDVLILICSCFCFICNSNDRQADFCFEFDSYKTDLWP